MSDQPAFLAFRSKLADLSYVTPIAVASPWSCLVFAAMSHDLVPHLLLILMPWSVAVGVALTLPWCLARFSNLVAGFTVERLFSPCFLVDLVSGRSLTHNRVDHCVDHMVLPILYGLPSHGPTSVSLTCFYVHF